MRRFRSGFTGIVFLLGADAATAQDVQDDPKSCPYAPAILATADYLLTEPTQNPGFWRDRHGDDAAYLKIRYAGTSYPEARALLEKLGQRNRPPERLLELNLAHANATDRAVMIEGLATAQAPKSPLPSLGTSAWRALVVDGGSDWFLQELARSLDTDPLARATMPAMARSLASLDDKTIAAFARQAEDAELWQFAYYAYSQEADLADLVAYLDRMPAEAYPDASGSLEEKRKSALSSAFTQTYSRAVFDILIQPTEVKALAGARPEAVLMRMLAELAEREPETILLSTALNQTGEWRIASEVAFGLLADIKAKRLDAANEPDSVIASMVQSLDDVLTTKGRETLLLSFQMTGPGGQRSTETAAAFVDKALTRYALGPFVRGEAPQPPRPEALTAEFPWDRWAGVAVTLVEQKPVAEDDRLIAAELLAAAGKPPEALQVLDSAADWKSARLIAHAMLRRLDWRCGSLLDNPLPYFEPLYRFEPL